MFFTDARSDGADAGRNADAVDKDMFCGWTTLAPENAAAGDLVLAAVPVEAGNPTMDCAHCGGCSGGAPADGDMATAAVAVAVGDAADSSCVAESSVGRVWTCTA
jgi:hypothetical protein